MTHPNGNEAEFPRAPRRGWRMPEDLATPPPAAPPVPQPAADVEAGLHALFAGPLRAAPALLVVARGDAHASGWGPEAAIELATVAAEHATSVALVDLGLDAPVLHERLGVSNDEGVTEVVLFGVSLVRAAQPVEGRRFLLVPAGVGTPDPAEVLASPRWERIVAEAARREVMLLLYVPGEMEGLGELGERVGQAVILAGAGEDLAAWSPSSGSFQAVAVLSPVATPQPEFPATPQLPRPAFGAGTAEDEETEDEPETEQNLAPEALDTVTEPETATDAIGEEPLAFADGGAETGLAPEAEAAFEPVAGAGAEASADAEAGFGVVEETAPEAAPEAFAEAEVPSAEAGLAPADEVANHIEVADEPVPAAEGTAHADLLAEEAAPVVEAEPEPEAAQKPAPNFWQKLAKAFAPPASARSEAEAEKAADSPVLPEARAEEEVAPAVEPEVEAEAQVEVEEPAFAPEAGASDEIVPDALPEVEAAEEFQPPLSAEPQTADELPPTLELDAAPEAEFDAAPSTVEAEASEAVAPTAFAEAGTADEFAPTADAEPLEESQVAPAEVEAEIVAASAAVETEVIPDASAELEARDEAAPPSEVEPEEEIALALQIEAQDAVTPIAPAAEAEEVSLAPEAELELAEENAPQAEAEEEIVPAAVEPVEEAVPAEELAPAAEAEPLEEAEAAPEAVEPEVVEVPALVEAEAIQDAPPAEAAAEEEQAPALAAEPEEEVARALLVEEQEEVAPTAEVEATDEIHLAAEAEAAREDEIASASAPLAPEEAEEFVSVALPEEDETAAAPHAHPEDEFAPAATGDAEREEVEEIFTARGGADDFLAEPGADRDDPGPFAAWTEPEPPRPAAEEAPAGFGAEAAAAAQGEPGEMSLDEWLRAAGLAGAVGAPEEPRAASPRAPSTPDAELGLDTAGDLVPVPERDTDFGQARRDTEPAFAAEPAADLDFERTAGFGPQAEPAAVAEPALAESFDREDPRAARIEARGRRDTGRDRDDDDDQPTPGGGSPRYLVPRLSAWKERLIRLLAVVTLLVWAYYIAWRWAYTLNPGALWFSIPLALAETWGLVAACVMAHSVWRLKHRAPLPAPEGLSVDVYVTCYDEPLEVIRRTAVGARAIRYPHRTYILDDGKRAEVRAMAEELGIGYLRREGNEHAKAGNLNHALAHTGGEFVLQLDADHVALPHILDRMLGFFGADPKLAFVQSPQDFYNIDAFTYDVDETARRIWEEQRLFFTVLQPGKDRLNAAFFCGSCAVIRRAALDEIGGFSTGSVTEDIETSIRLHARGWNSAFYGESLAYGLAAGSATAFHTQHLRWGQGAMQVLRRYNPLTLPGLSIHQRIAYFGSLTAYVGGVQKLVFLLAPVIFFLSGALPIRALDASFAVHFVPVLLLSLLLAGAVSRGTGNVWISERFQVAKFWTYTRAVFSILHNRPLRFHVTPKGPGHVPFRAYAPQVVLGVALVLSVAWALLAMSRGWIDYGDGAWQSPGFVVNVIWASVSFGLAASVVELSLRVRHQRADHRFRDRFPIRVLARAPGGGALEPMVALTEDLNPAGIAFRTGQRLDSGTRVRLTLPLATGEVRVYGKVVHSVRVDATEPAMYRSGVVFGPVPMDVRDAIELHCAHHSIPLQQSQYRPALRFLAGTARRLRNVRREPRQAVQLPAHVWAGTASHPGTGGGDGPMAFLEELSPSGARLVMDTPLAPGTPIRFRVPGTTLERAGRVVFSRAIETPIGVRYAVGVRQAGVPAVVTGQPLSWLMHVVRSPVRFLTSGV